MTRKDFELLACAIRDVRARGLHPAYDLALDDLASELGARLGRTNDRFDRQRFERACS